MLIVKIITKKQDNGIWGVPMSVSDIKYTCVPNDYEHLLISAIMITFAEQYPNHRFSFDCRDKQMFATLSSNSRQNRFILRYNDYRVIGNKLYYLENEHDKKLFKLICIKKVLNKI